MRAAYYNELDPYAAQWLRNLVAAGHIADGEVDERSIVAVRPDDIAGFEQCHFFAGIGGWSLALRLAGWPDDRPVWTGSCPCQVVSSAARGAQNSEDLWPAWFALIASSRPGTIFGEQVAQSSEWLDRVCDDLEPLDYEIGAAILPACSVGQDHIRQRIYFAGNANREGKPSASINVEMARMQWHRSDARSVVQAHGLPDRMASLRAFGNAIVPQVAAEFIVAIMNGGA